MKATRKIAVAGATGRVGRHVVDALTERGHEVVSIARAAGVDVVTGDGLDAALAGVECVIDAATGPSPEREAATEFFTTAARNIHEVGLRAGVQRVVMVSIIGTERFAGGYGAAKAAHEDAHLKGALPVAVVRAAQFHEFIEQLLEWGTQGDVAYVPNMRTQLVAARTVGDVLADLAVDCGAMSRCCDVAGPREEHLPDAAQMLVARRGLALKIEGVSDASDPDSVLYESGALLPGPDALLGGPTFEEWLTSTSRTN